MPLDWVGREVMQLLPHQIEVVEKFRNVRARLVGDSMGVGKTVTGIGLDLDLRKEHGKPGAHIRTLIICQKNGIAVWRRHLLEFGVDPKRVLTIDPKDRTVFERELELGAKRYDYFVIHWDVLVKVEEVNDGKIIWDHVIADEAHLAKNRQAARTRELKKIKCRVKTALTGTPADDKPQDLWSILNWLYPKHYTAFWRFFNTYLEWNDYSGYRQVTGVKNIDKLHEEIDPFYIRRTLFDVREDMPKKSYSRIEVELSPKQRKMYNDMSDFHIANLGDDDHDLVAPIAISVLQRLQKMALGACSIDWTESDWQTYYSEVAEFEEAHYLWELGGRKGKKPKRPAGPSIRVEEPSAKLDGLFELIETNEDEPFVVFSQFSDFADLVEARCKRKKIPVSKITGSVTSQLARDAAVSSFQGGATRLFVGTIGAAGTSITLNRAHTVVFVDRDWNPSKNAQAEDRIYRIDNDAEPIQVIDLVAKDTVDEYRLERIGKKALWLKQMLAPRGIIEVTGDTFDPSELQDA